MATTFPFLSFWPYLSLLRSNMRAILYVGFLIVALVKAQGGVVSTYYDDTCRDAIGTWTFELGECYNHPMLEGGISVGSFPACESGVPSLSVSDNANCEIPSVAISFYDTVVDSCYYLSGTAGMASAKFFCDISNSGSGSTGGSSTSEISVSTCELTMDSLLRSLRLRLRPRPLLKACQQQSRLL